jgi:hypothetical protein
MLETTTEENHGNRLMKYRCFLLVAALLLLAKPSTAQEYLSHSDCGHGTLRNRAGVCTPIEQVLSADGGRVFWVAQQQGNASDGSPGTKDQPWKTISRATRAGALAPGDAVIVREGLYREDIRPEVGGTGADSRITFAAYTGEEVVVSGADEMQSGWSQSGDAWKHGWTSAMPAPRSDQDPVFRRELVVVDGAVMRAVFAREDLVPGTFFVEGTDHDPEALYVRLPHDAAPHNHSIEVGIRTRLFAPADLASCDARTNSLGWYRLTGFTFRHASNYAQHGAICPGREGSLFEENTVEWTNGTGIKVAGAGHVLRGNRSLDNGMAGIGGSCDSCLLEYNEASRNNWKNYGVTWSSGGGKWIQTRNTVFRHHVARDNNGPGIWLDHENEDNTVASSHFVGNKLAGIFLELKTVRTTVRNCVVYGTRWHAWSGAGVLSQAASHNVIVHNTFVANDGEGIRLRLDPNRRAPEGYNTVYNNLFVKNARLNDGSKYEIFIDDEDLAHARTNRLDGNLYWPHDDHDLGRIFFFGPDPERAQGYRGNDINRWMELMQGDAQARIVDAALPLLEDPSTAEGWRLVSSSQAAGKGVAVPADVEGALKDIDGDLRPQHGAGVGADEISAPRLQHRLVLEQGWNIISSYVQPTIPSMDALFEPIRSNVVMVKDEKGQIYSPAKGIDTIGQWRSEEAYRIYATARMELAIAGHAVAPEATPLSLQEGRNLVPYLLSEPLAPEVALASLGDALILVMDNMGRIYYPELEINTLGELKPGQGYQVYLSRNSEMIYPKASDLANLQVESD